MANNALAPNIDNVLSDYVYAGRKLKEQRTNNLLNPQVKTAMTLADLQALKGAPTQRTPTLGERVEGLSYAAGEGFKDQLEGFKQMLTTNPKDTLMAMYEGLKHVVQDPSILADMGKQAVSSPENFTRFLAQNLNPMDLANVLNKVGTMRELTVYHGTPHTLPPTANNPLGEFDASKIGTGEGAAAYGHGIYVAENPAVAKQYANMPNFKRAVVENADIFGKSGKDFLSRIEKLGSVEKAKTEATELLKEMKAQNMFPSVQDQLKNEIQFANEHGNKLKVKSTDIGSNVYTVDLPDEKIDQMLDWDKPLSEQSAHVQKVIEHLRNDPNVYFPKLDTDAEGQKLYRFIGVNKQAPIEFGGKKYIDSDASTISELLRQRGISGIKYLDEQSRAKGAGTRNFVVFPGEEKSLKILKRE